MDNGARVEQFITEHGLPLLFVAIAVESFGIPIPGEATLIAFGVLASQGHYAIEVVILVAAAGAIVGDNLGYELIGRKGGHALLHRSKRLGAWADKVLPRGEAIMARHGGKTVFFGRFVAVLRYTVAWIAGITGMEWRRFLGWNALGGICWATLVGLTSYWGGQALADEIERDGVLVAVVAAVGLVIAWLIYRRVERRVSEEL